MMWNTFLVLYCSSSATPQNALITTSSMRISVWKIVLRDTLPTGSNRSVCVAMTIAPRVTALALMTVKCVGTGKRCVTMESVGLSVRRTRTMLGRPMNVEVGKLETWSDVRQIDHHRIFYLSHDSTLLCLMMFYFPRMWQVMFDLLRPWALILSQLWPQQAERCQWTLCVVHSVLLELILGPEWGLPSVSQSLWSLFWARQRRVP